MQQYLDVVRDILDNGYYRPNPHNPDNRDEGSLGLFEQQIRFKPAEEFPWLTSRDLSKSWKAMVAELLWFLSGSTDVRDLHQHGVRFWDQWAKAETSGLYGYPEFELGPLYGHQWRNFGATRRSRLERLARRLIVGRDARYEFYRHDGYDQITQLVEEIKGAPNSKRLKVSTWNPNDVEHLWLAPCHGDIKCFVAGGRLSMSMWQRSADVPIGVPFNIGSYSLLLLMLAQVTGNMPGEFVHNLSDAHIYMNQVENMKELVKREPLPLPRVQLDMDVKDLFGFRIEDFELVNYHPHPGMSDIPVAL